MKIVFFSLCLILCQLAAASTGDVLRTIAAINAAIEKSDSGAKYDVTAKLTQPPNTKLLTFHAADETGATQFGMDPSLLPSMPVNAGDIVHIKGYVTSANKGKVGLHSHYVSFIKHGNPIPAYEISGKELYENSGLRNRLVRMKGIVYDAFRDEIDYLWSFLVLNCDDSIIYAAIFSEDISDNRINELIGSTVSIEGMVTDHYYGNRITLERYLALRSFDAVKTISSGDADPFNVPEISKSYFPPSETPFKSGRRRATGTVVATWQHGKRILVKQQTGSLVCAELSSRHPPTIGEQIEVSGFQETDFYRINLARAVWRAFADNYMEPLDMDVPKPVPAKSLFADTCGHQIKNVDHFGETIKIRGIVKSLSAFGSDTDRIYIESNSFLVPVDASACPKALKNVTADCTLDVTGICIAETENWSSTRMFPKIREILIAVRSPDDIKIISRPPWWTTGRLLTVIGGLMATLLGIFGWNIALSRRAEQRGRELASEQIAHVTSELKVYERTRLAVELHDSLSQTLTGVSLGISSAIDLAKNIPESLKRQLEYTSKTVEACRTELRNCLWDLRNEVLETTDMNRAIKLSLGQIVNHAAISVRFNIPRSRLSDKTTHMILRIIRELASNAIRHGNASKLMIAGCIDGETLHFSVKDNGTGFDPMNTPGISKGHFGLQGIQERLDLIDGEMHIDSAIGECTKITISIRIPNKKTTEEHAHGKDKNTCCG